MSTRFPEVSEDACVEGRSDNYLVNSECGNSWDCTYDPPQSFILAYSPSAFDVDPVVAHVWVINVTYWERVRDRRVDGRCWRCDADGRLAAESVSENPASPPHPRLADVLGRLRRVVAPRVRRGPPDGDVVGEVVVSIGSSGDEEAGGDEDVGPVGPDGFEGCRCPAEEKLANDSFDDILVSDEFPDSLGVAGLVVGILWLVERNRKDADDRFVDSRGNRELHLLECE